MYVCSYFDSSTDKGTRKEWLREHELSFVGSYFASIDNSMHFSSIAPWSRRCCASFRGKNLSTVITIVSEVGINMSNFVGYGIQRIWLATRQGFSFSFSTKYYHRV